MSEERGRLVDWEVSVETGAREAILDKDGKDTGKTRPVKETRTAKLRVYDTHAEFCAACTAKWASKTGGQPLDAGECVPVLNGINTLAHKQANIELAPLVRKCIRENTPHAEEYDSVDAVLAILEPRTRAKRSNEATDKLRAFLKKMQAGGLSIEDMASFAECEVDEVKALLA